MKPEIECAKQALSKHCGRYPLLEIPDVLKYLYQSAFGCEHMVPSEERALRYLRAELDSMAERIAEDGGAEIEPLDGAYCRVPLSYLKGGLLPETLGRLFFLSAKPEPCGKERMENGLAAAIQLAEEGAFPFSAESLKEAIAAWREAGMPAVHHSQAFREHYRPAYRVIAKEYAALLPLLEKIDRLRNGERVPISAMAGAVEENALEDLLNRIYGDAVRLDGDGFILRIAQGMAKQS